MRASGDGIDDAERRIDIEAAMQRLPWVYRATAVAYYLGGCSCAEIAEHEGVSTRTIQRHLACARSLLREWLV